MGWHTNWTATVTNRMFTRNAQLAVYSALRRVSDTVPLAEQGIDRR